MIKSKPAAVTFVYHGRQYTYVYATKAFDVLLHIEEGETSQVKVTETIGTNCHELRPHESPRLPVDSQILFAQEWSRTDIPEAWVGGHAALSALPPEFVFLADVSGGRTVLSDRKRGAEIPYWLLGQIVGYAGENKFAELCKSGVVARINWPEELKK